MHQGTIRRVVKMARAWWERWIRVEPLVSSAALTARVLPVNLVSTFASVLLLEKILSLVGLLGISSLKYSHPFKPDKVRTCTDLMQNFLNLLFLAIGPLGESANIQVMKI